MKKVKCVDNCKDGMSLTVGKIYDVVDEEGDCYDVENDMGVIGLYSKYGFTDAGTYTLELSHEELVTMRVLSGSVLGNDLNSPRRHTDSAYNKMCGILNNYNTDTLIEYNLLRGRTIAFDDYPIQEEPIKEKPAKNSLQLKAEIDFSDAKNDIEELIELLKQAEAIKNRIFKEV